MNSIKLLVGVSLLTMTLALSASSYPSLSIQNGETEIMLFLPDQKDSYYQASRFDWGSMVGQVRYKNHTFLQQWKDYNGRGPVGEHDPLTPNTGTGLAEEFIMPLGYEEADSNGHFVKIGVGVLQKADKAAYSFATRYKIVDTGKRTVRKKGSSVVITHRLSSRIGYAYWLERTYRVEANRLIVAHTLRNTGEKRITTETYSHNFMQFDFGAFCPDFSLEFLKSDIDATNHKWVTANRVKIAKNRVDIVKPFNDFIPCFGNLDLLSKRGDFRLINRKTGMALTMQVDRELSSFVVWMWQKAFSAEPRLTIDIEPGKSFRWEYVYSFEI